MRETFRSIRRPRSIFFNVLDDLGVCAEPRAELFCAVYDFLQYPNTRSYADDVRVHRQLENAMLLAGKLEVIEENINDISWRRVRPKG